MARGRSALAAQTSPDKLIAAVCEAFGASLVDDEQPVFDDFNDAVDFCRPYCEDLGGEVGHDGWYAWPAKRGWSVLGDLGSMLQDDPDRLAALSSALGSEVVVCCLDPYVEYACFASYAGGRETRKLLLEEGELLAEGLPVPAERGHHNDVDFDEVECERLWTSYGLPTFEHDPIDGPFTCVAVKRDG